MAVVLESAPTNFGNDDCNAAVECWNTGKCTFTCKIVSYIFMTPAVVLLCHCGVRLVATRILIRLLRSWLCRF